MAEILSIKMQSYTLQITPRSHKNASGGEKVICLVLELLKTCLEKEPELWVLALFSHQDRVRLLTPDPQRRTVEMTSCIILVIIKASLTTTQPVAFTWHGGSPVVQGAASSKAIRTNRHHWRLDTAMSPQAISIILLLITSKILLSQVLNSSLDPEHIINIPN